MTEDGVRALADAFVVSMLAEVNATLQRGEYDLALAKLKDLTAVDRRAEEIVATLVKILARCRSPK